jgi:hypothetical protein
MVVKLARTPSHSIRFGKGSSPKGRLVENEAHSHWANIKQPNGVVRSDVRQRTG